LEDRAIGRIEIYNKPDGSTHYSISGDPTYFDNNCDLLSFLVVETMLTCDPNEVSKYVEYYLSTINLTPDTTSTKKRIY
jgi:hypothetical protein